MLAIQIHFCSAFIQMFLSANAQLSNHLYTQVKVKVHTWRREI